MSSFVYILMEHTHSPAVADINVPQSFFLLHLWLTFFLIIKSLPTNQGYDNKDIFYYNLCYRV